MATLQREKKLPNFFLPKQSFIYSMYGYHHINIMIQVSKLLCMYLIGTYLTYFIYFLVKEMRRQRIAMVQTVDQYVLCHRYVLIFFTPLEKFRTC